MTTEKKIKKALAGIKHPETGRDIVSAGIVADIAVDGDKVSVVLEFAKKRDPFANSIKRQVGEAVRAIAGENTEVEVSVREHEAPKEKQQPPSTTGAIKKVIAVASGKGGVGKSTVTANLAVTLRDMGYRVGILDADVYGPSQPKMFGVEDYSPAPAEEGAGHYILPAVADGIKIASIGFFIRPEDALIWRGPMVANALRQLVHQTYWEEIDYLLIDLPPGTGDVHLSVLAEIKVDGAVMVSTPQQIAVADLRRGLNMFRNPNINVPILGVVENMAWFTPAELPGNRYYLFGRGGARAFAEAEGVELLGEIPIIQSVMDGAEDGHPAVETNPEVKKYYAAIAEKIVANDDMRI